MQQFNPEVFPGRDIFAARPGDLDSPEPVIET